uniref:Uncharacterized protein n=1 Tax=Utricularia reniformis TaxID=192314 RepID=A0A1Y0B426_9LAMI|nr:hypothetical protein AEK19_MT1981 [Utricularia reniformis]ART32144.1 hypothetical protein AEK19_MT1981 [Utricularia reniformis]
MGESLITWVKAGIPSLFVYLLSIPIPYSERKPSLFFHLSV